MFYLLFPKPKPFLIALFESNSDFISYDVGGGDLGILINDIRVTLW